MTSLERTLALGSYRESLVHAARLAESHGDALRESLRHEASAPSGIDANEWSGASGALRFAYEVGAREGFASVGTDIKARLGAELTEAEFAGLLALLEEDPLVSQRIAGTRERDGILPNLVGLRLSLDLRAVQLEKDSGDELQLAPTVTARLEFDEHVAGQDALVFQIPLWSLEELIEDLGTIRERVARVGEQLPTATVPVWARAIDSRDERS